MQLKTSIPYIEQLPQIEFKYRFTVFTPVYNGAETIERVFKSLNSQTFLDFELVIINDGSEDNSNEKIIELLKDASFPVNYINNKINKNKMSCFFEAIKEAKGEFLLPFDADDECIADALKILETEYTNIPEHLKPQISGVTALCRDQNNEMVGDEFPEDPFYSNSFESNNLHKIRGEKWGFTKTSILKGIHINEELFGKGLIPESTIWYLISKNNYLTKYVNKPLRIYYTDTPGSLSTPNYKKNALGAVVHSIASINWFQKKYLLKTPKFFLKRLFVLLRSSNYLDFKKADYLTSLDSGFIRNLCFLLWPLRRILLRLIK